jgi:cell wall-associated NlpC family hydrolase
VNHWAADLVGREWTPEFNCWALVREVIRRKLGIEMPELAAGIPAIVVAGNWHIAKPPAKEFDLVVAHDLKRKRHVGVLVEWREGLQMLHNVEGEGVIRQTLLDASRQLAGIEFWRRA